MVGGTVLNFKMHASRFPSGTGHRRSARTLPREPRKSDLAESACFQVMPLHVS
jgi:hypothetical protein